MNYGHSHDLKTLIGSHTCKFKAGFNSEVQFVYFPCSSIACKRIMGNIPEKHDVNSVSASD